MLSFTARMPYHGLYEWSVIDVDTYADTLRADHQPHRVWEQGREPACRTCGDAWPCSSYAWADQWSHSTTRAAAHEHR